MKHNIVLADRTIRVGAGMLLLASPLLELPTYPLNLFGLALIASAVAGYCPIYSLLAALRPGSSGRSARPPQRTAHAAR